MSISFYTNDHKASNHVRRATAFNVFECCRQCALSLIDLDIDLTHSLLPAVGQSEESSAAVLVVSGKIR